LPQHFPVSAHHFAVPIAPTFYHAPRESAPYARRTVLKNQQQQRCGHANDCCGALPGHHADGHTMTFTCSGHARLYARAFGWALLCFVNVPADAMPMSPYLQYHDTSGDWTTYFYMYKKVLL
jgi:hypothetical protein